MKLEPSEMIRALSVETRLRIIELLKAKGPLGAKKIAGLIGITPAGVSQHLRTLRQAGLIRSERKGYWIPYSINEEALESCRQVLNEVCTCGCRGSGEFREKGLNEFSLASLKKREKQLQSELTAVREKIKAMALNKK